MPQKPDHDETFTVEDGHLVRRVIPRRGRPYEHRCPRDAYRELAWAALDLAADGFTVTSLVDHIRDLPQETHDDPRPWVSHPNAAVALAFWKERGCVTTRYRRNFPASSYLYEDAMIEFEALAETP